MNKKGNVLIKCLIAIVILLVVLNATMILSIYNKHSHLEENVSEVVLQQNAVSESLEADKTEMTWETTPIGPEDEDAETTPAESTEEVLLAEPEGKTASRIVYDNVPLYYQTDYPNDRFGHGTIKSSGCSITSLSMVASYLTGHEYLPDELADYFGGYGENNMQKLEYASDMLQLPWKKAQNVHEVTNAVKEGNVAILMMNQKSIFTDSQHFIVLAGMTEEGRFIVNDPFKPNYEKWDLKRAFQEGFKEGDIICGFSGGWIYDVSAMPEEPYIYVENKPYVEPRYPGIELTWEEQQLLAKVIWTEARGEPVEGQQAIAEIVFNRMTSEGFPDTLRGVIYEDNQFRSVSFLEDAEPTQAQYDAIDDALEGPYVLPTGVVHFATYPVNGNVWGTIGGHVFCYQWGVDNQNLH